VHCPAAREHLPEDQRQSAGWQGARDEFREIVAQLRTSNSVMTKVFSTKPVSAG